MSKTTVTAEHYADGIVSRANPKHILIQEAMIEFAKIKVKEALEDAAEKVKNEQGGITEGLKQSIIQAYDIESIK